MLLVGIIVTGSVWFLFLRPPQEAAAPIESIPIETAVSFTSDANFTIFEIVPAESEARFMLGETLRGEPTTVVGTTNQVGGEIAIDFENPQTAQVGIIQVNARTLLTDNNFRNNAIRNRILFTDAYEFITFRPTTISGLPTSITPGEPVAFQITGALTIKDITNEVTFAVTVTPVAETRLEGHATTTVARSDYELGIPSARGVADVDEVVTVEIDFVAVERATVESQS